ncbi:AMP-binding protein [Spirosoma taeanense]|uniref:AMP-binding protein n=1 Tax=Spirosoma taeanense TaxID=2735870 RepID=A0A6M5Y3Y1_9BACT|nr:AMP-binding protein [Spirosoma taeanense]QJW88086.1 AMP-binding protein [Spirosoma taeanense]
MSKQTDLQKRFVELRTIIEARQYDKLKTFSFPIPDEFNWVRDVFEPIILEANAERLMLELVTDGHASPVTLTYRQGFDKSNQLVNLLRRQGVQQGERIFIMCGLDEGVWITYLAAITGGYVLIPAASILSTDDVVYRFQNAFPKVIIADLENAEKLEQALLEYQHPVAIKLLLDGQRKGWVSFETIATEETTAQAANTKKDEDLFWFFTSGTTGLPKVAVHTHASYPLGHLTTAVWIGLRAGDKHYNIAQPGWAKFAWSSVFAPLIVGATIFSYKSKGRFMGSDQLRLIQDHHITTLCAPPTAFRLLIQEKLDGYQFHLRECVSAGEPLNAEIIKTWKEGTGIQIRDGYGQTETTCMISNLPGSPVKYGSMGKPSFLYDIWVVDEEGHELPLLETGQIAVQLNPDRFQGIFKTYLGDTERQKGAFKHGLYYTGDKAYKDEEGYYWFVGRDDDVIKSSAYRVGPFEIESVLLEVDEVLESAVVGSPHPIRGQEIKAFVVLVGGEAASRAIADKLFAHCKKNLALYKVPRLIEFVSELPKTISGKIRRVELRAAEEQRKISNEKRPHEYLVG